MTGRVPNSQHDISRSFAVVATWRILLNDPTMLALFFSLLSFHLYCARFEL